MIPCFTVPIHFIRELSFALFHRATAGKTSLGGAATKPFPGLRQKQAFRELFGTSGRTCGGSEHASESRQKRGFPTGRITV
jgi:hypothetical protein